MRLAATLSLTVMFALAKLAQMRGVNLIEILFFRQSIMILPVVAIAAMGPGLASLKTRQPMTHAKRAMTGLSGMALNFATVGLLPLAEAQTIWFTTPLFATILAATWLGEKVGPHRWGAVLVGFAGVLIVFQPQSGHLPVLGGSIGLASAFMVSITAILVRQLGRTDGSLTTVFWFGVTSSLAMLIPLPWALHAHDVTTWLILAAMGFVGALGQITLTLSLRFAPVSVVAPVDYASLLWSIALGFLVFDTLPTPWTWVGAPVIMMSGLYIVAREHRRGRANALATAAAEA
jgi:drug/metabolite transporter (DMT)-like permease